MSEICIERDMQKLHVQRLNYQKLASKSQLFSLRIRLHLINSLGTGVQLFELVRKPSINLNTGQMDINRVPRNLFTNCRLLLKTSTL